MPCSPDVSLTELAHLTAGYTGADIKLVCREAAVAALEVFFHLSHGFHYYFLLLDNCSSLHSFHEKGKDDLFDKLRSSYICVFFISFQLSVIYILF